MELHSIFEINSWRGNLNRMPCHPCRM